MDVGPAHETVVRLQKFVVDVANYFRPSFPTHAAALKDAVIERKMNDDRWHRVLAILESFTAVPGVTLSPIEHIRRNVALSTAELAAIMAQIMFGGRDVTRLLAFAEWLAADIKNQMETA